MKLPSLIPVGRERGAATEPFLSHQREIDRLFEGFTRGFPSMQTFTYGNGGMLMPSTDVTPARTIFLTSSSVTSSHRHT